MDFIVMGFEEENGLKGVVETSGISLEKQLQVWVRGLKLTELKAEGVFSLP